MTAEIRLRDVREIDLPLFFEHQMDPTANRMAAFGAEDPADRGAYRAHGEKILGDETVPTKTVLCEGEVAGHIESFERFGKPEVAYWIGREYWGKGVATRALEKFLKVVLVRPLYARAAKDNLASIRVLEKCGFTLSGHDRAYANARGEETEEVVLELTGT
mgnify:CR=1 FL=1